MVEINSVDYHDFVIKDGRLIGEFEQMYQKSNGVPWHQDEQEEWLDVRMTIELLGKYPKYNYICDFSAGLGYYLDILGRHVGDKKVVLQGYDISSTCIEKAKQLFPGISFFKNDLTQKNEKSGIIGQNGSNRLFVLRGTLWYLFYAMNDVVEHIGSIANEGDHFFISQNFPALNTDFVGKEVLPDPEAIVDYFSKYFKPIISLWLEDRVNQGNDNWFLVLFSRRK